MRRGLLLCVVAVPLLAACGAPDGVPEWKDAAPESAAPSVPGSAPAVPGAASGDRFVAEVRDRLPELALDRRPEEITEMGGEACAGLAAGRQRAAVAETLQGYGVGADDARELVALAGADLCRS